VSDAVVNVGFAGAKAEPAAGLTADLTNSSGRTAPVGYSRDAIFRVLAALDRLLEEALRLAPEAYGWEPGAVRFRGLYISASDAGRMLASETGASPFTGLSAGPFFAVEDVPQLAALAERYSLAWFDCAVVLIALAPEVDLRYERLYAYLQDDVSRRRPSVNLILDLLCPQAADRIDAQCHFAADSVLVRERIIHLWPEANQSNPPLLALGVKVDQQISREMLGMKGLDSRLAEFGEYSFPDTDLAPLPLEPETIAGLRRLAMYARTGSHPLRVWLNGADVPLRRKTAQAIAATMDRPLLSLRLSHACTFGTDAGELIPVAAREASLANAVLLIECDGVDERTSLTVTRCMQAARSPVDLLVAAASLKPELDPLFLTAVDFSRPSFATRREHWRRSLPEENIELLEGDVDTLAARFRLYPDEIRATAAAARSRARWRGSARTLAADLSASARAISGRQIGALARKIEPKYRWDDIVLPSETANQLRAMCARVAHQHRVLDEWGFDRKLSLGKGVTALFAGPSGVGKTMAAEIISSALDIDLYKIDLAGVVSKYIGETEKNLDRIFAAAENANAILFFDEADALFGKRSEVKDSHDRYANIEISYLLQKMEMYQGVAILATNLRQNLDDAFLRRLAFTVHFPLPSQEDRKLIWEAIWPESVPLGPGTDFEFLAARFKFTGGNIKNIALAAAFLAAEENSPVSMRHLLIAVDREFQKMGKPLGPEAFAPYSLEAVS
jgi:AAA+ superfamily predicted ATPase